MRKKLSLMALAGILLCTAACKKKSDNGDAMKYIVNNVADINVRSFTDSAVYMPVVMEHMGGTQEAVTVKITDLPPGATVTPDSINGTPTFTGAFMINFYFATTGSYPVKVVSKGSKSGTKTLTYNINVTSRACTDFLVGTYTEKSGCMSDSTTGYIRLIRKASDDVNLVIDHDGYKLDATTNCSNSTITVAEKALGPAYRISGTGSFGAKTITMNWTVKNGSLTTYCRSVYTRM